MRKYIIAILFTTITGFSQAQNINDQAQDFYLQKALEIEKSLSSQINKDGVIPVANDDDKVSNSISDGVAGNILFYLELFNATKNQKFLKLAKSFGEQLISKAPELTDTIPSPFWAFSMYGNYCGPAFALSQLSEITKNKAFFNGAIKYIDFIYSKAIISQDSISWDLGNDILGGLSGTALFFLDMYERTNEEKYLQIAEKAGNTLIGRAIPQGEGLTWKRGQDSKYILPNFSHGASGIGYFFAKLYENTKDHMYLSTAIKAGIYLDSIASTRNNTYNIPYGFPDPGWSTPFDIGWAHGPAGNARYFQIMKSVTKDNAWELKIINSYNSLVQFGIPNTPKEDFGEDSFKIDMRFGIASAADFVADIYLNTNEKKYKTFSQSIVNSLLSKSRLINGKREWPVERYSFMANPGKISVFNGYFYGSTGFGLLMLKMYYAEMETKGLIYLPDNPF